VPALRACTHADFITSADDLHNECIVSLGRVLEHGMHACK